MMRFETGPAEDLLLNRLQTIFDPRRDRRLHVVSPEPRCGTTRINVSDLYRFGSRAQPHGEDAGSDRDGEAESPTICGATE
jgi:hypothetical protein